MAKKHGFINVDFDPNLKTVEQDFVRLGKRFEDKRTVMLAAMVVARHDIDEMFEGEHDAFGDPWAPWKDTKPPSGNQSYATRAQNYPNIGILRRKDDLHQQAIKEEQFHIDNDFLTYGDDLPEWAGVHLHGGQKVQPDGYVIPQRSFYPYSPEGVQKVHMLFDDWAERNIAIMQRTTTTGRTVTMIRGRGAGGRFTPSGL